MGRIHPEYCEHDKMIDGGDFFEPGDFQGCPECDAKPNEVELIAEWLNDLTECIWSDLPEGSWSGSGRWDRIKEIQTKLKEKGVLL